MLKCVTTKQLFCILISVTRIENSMGCLNICYINFSNLPHLLLQSLTVLRVIEYDANCTENSSVQYFFYLRLFIYRRWNVITEPLPSNDRGGTHQGNS
jgi:hypothetical protein